MNYKNAEIPIREVPPPAEWGVTVSNCGIKALVERWRTERFDDPRFDYPGLPDWEGPAWLDLAVLGTSVMACLWASPGAIQWGVTWQSQELVDASAIWACFARFGQPGPAGMDIGRFQHLQESDQFFRGVGHLQLIPLREQRIRAVSTDLKETFGGHALRLFEQVRFHGPTAVQLLSSQITGFRDRVSTPTGDLNFSKLAYLAVAVAAARSPVTITGLEDFPLYPDYMLPVVLRKHNILRYTPDLAKRVDSQHLIPPGSRAELAIRWATVYAGQQIISNLNRAGNPVIGPQLDYRLWTEAVISPTSGQNSPHHRTVTLAY